MMVTNYQYDGEGLLINSIQFTVYVFGIFTTSIVMIHNWPKREGFGWQEFAGLLESEGKYF
jgi:hypothetical protein